MSDFLYEKYVNWLTQYKTKIDHPSVQSIAGELINSMPKVKSISELISLLTKYMNPEGDDTKLQNPTLYGPINFYAQLLAWQTELAYIVIDHPRAKNILREIPISPATEPLMQFLNELMSDSKLMMHTKMPNLINVLCGKQLPSVLNFIAHLKEVPPPLTAKPGSFAALPPKNSHHASCLALLNNLSEHSNKKNILYPQAKNLLQSSLLMYQDIQMVEINLDDDKEYNTNQTERPTCAIL